MLSNGRHHMGQVQLALPLLASALRWAIPFIVVSGGMWLTGETVKKTFPDVPINKENIGLSAILGGAGIASYYFSAILPDDAKSVAYAVAVAGVASSLYFLFAPPKPIQIVPGSKIEATEQFPQVSPGALGEALTVFVDPMQPNTGGQKRFPWADQEYEVFLKNETKSKRSFYVGAAVSGEGSDVAYRSPKVHPVYGRKLVELAPAGQNGSEEFVKIKVPDTEAKAYTPTAVWFELYRQRDDDIRNPGPFYTSESIPIAFGFIPLG